jgi:threonine synthase
LAETGYLLDPHTAVGMVAAQKAHLDAEVPMVVLATAAPAKFPKAMQKITGETPNLPPRLSGLMTHPERMVHLGKDQALLEAHIRQNRQR